MSDAADESKKSIFNKITPDLHKHQGKLNAATLSMIGLMVPVMVAATPYLFDLVEKIGEKLDRHDDASEHLVEMQARQTQQWKSFASVIGDQNDAINAMHEGLEDAIDQCREGIHGAPRRELGDILKKVRRIERLGGKQAMRKMLLDIDLRPEDLEEARADVYDQQMAEHGLGEAEEENEP